MKINYTKVLLVLVLITMVVSLAACKKHEHVYGEWLTAVEASCVNNGVQTRTCSCGYEETRLIDATEHSYGEWVTVIEATCSNDGVQTRACSCGYEEINLIAATEHSYGDWVTTVEPTCTNDGVQTRTCVCGNKETLTVTANGNHIYGDWMITTFATCMNEGVETRTCACGEAETRSISATEAHSYGAWVITTEATCANEGVKTRTCVCGAKENKSISAKEHSYGNWMVTTASTCTKEGVQSRTCSCGHQESKTIKKAVHKWQQATCTSPKICKTCFATVGEALDHTINCSGYCTGCGKKITVDMKTLVSKPSECVSIRKYGFSFSKNSNNEIKICWGGQNLSGKTVTSYSVTVYFYNDDGGRAYSEITGQSSKTVTYKNTVSPYEDFVIFDVIDYVSGCSGIVIGDITLEYQDGTRDIGWYGWGTKYNNSAIRS